ncbi:unnamed protein product [Owenia fusiformis]|uniref:Uracil-DNA glycosylase n=1 Tax=Owenia fusiformis TaxID=6347 RepID=A0A8J1UFY1_OWEFU|nr:unnamed protein product [Owenia fusiformis]
MAPKRKGTLRQDDSSGSKKKKDDMKRSKEKKSPSRAMTSKYLTLKNYIKADTWLEVLSEEFTKPYFIQLEGKLASELSENITIFPPKEKIFNALNITPLNQVRLVLLGQDPYHDDGQAMGLSFSVPEGIKIPPSLRNIYKELSTDIPGFTTPQHGCLEAWARQGVLLLNATLTVEAHKANSHSKYGWQKFTDEIIRKVSEANQQVVFLLWGGFAHKKSVLIDESKHTVIKTAHPSPLSWTKFEGCKCFSKVNKALEKSGKDPIDWTL